MKRMKVFLVLLAAALLLAGCGLLTVDELYAVPQRSEEYQNLQIVIQNAMVGMEYSAPLSGENQQTVQIADLEGDQVPEYLLFAKSTMDSSLKVLIFGRIGDDFFHRETISFSGASFDRVEYVRMDEHDGFELVVGRKLNDQVMRSVAVYSFAKGNAELLVSTSYSEFIMQDLDADRQSELFLLRAGEQEQAHGIAELYDIKNGILERSVEAPMSAPIQQLKRVIVGKLHDGIPAVYTACTVGDNGMITDAYALVNDKLVNVTISNESGTGIQTLRNYYVYAEDIDDDGIVELPDLINMHTLPDDPAPTDQYIVRWYAMTSAGAEVEKRFTYHNFVGGWYLNLIPSWAPRTLVCQTGNSFSFYVWNEDFTENEKILTIHVLTGNDREEQAQQDNRFVLYKTDTTVYCASNEIVSANYSMTRDDIINAFSLIHQDWKTGET